MYKNTIIFNGEPMFTFMTADLVFTTNNPRYKRVQEVLMDMGYEMQTNHTFNGVRKNDAFGGEGKKMLHFSYSGMKMYQPGKHMKELELEKKNWESVESSYMRLLLTNLKDIFVRELPIDIIECELLMTNAPDVDKKVI